MTPIKSFDDHSKHGLGTAEDGPDEPDCICRATERQEACSKAGCGFCSAAMTTKERPEDKQFYTVVMDIKDRMYPCKHAHLTPESAHECVKENNGVSIIEWVRERDPQFSEFWTRPDMKPPL